MHNLMLVLLALLLVALNGFFVAAEFGIVTLRPTRIRAIAKTQGLRGRILAKVHGQLDAYLSACQLGITLASLGLGWVGEPAFAALLEPVFYAVGISSPELVHGIAFAIAFCVISFLHIVVGELAPKTLSIRIPEIVSLWSALPLYGFYWAMYPFIWVLNASANGVLRLAGLAGAGQGHGHGNHFSTDELKLILRTHQPGKFTTEERKVLAHSLDFSQLSVSDLMRPINEVIALHTDQSVEVNVDTMLRNRFSRYPYFDGDEVLGMIHLKDLFFAQHAGKPIVDLADHLRPVETISGRTKAQDLFRRFKEGAPHFALIGEKGKRPLGFITLDNLLGAMVGEIHDEFRLNENDWLRQPDGTLVGKASLPIFSLERSLGIELTQKREGLGEVESVGGLLMLQLGDIPKQGQRIEFPGFDIVVKKMNGPRIVLVKVIPRRENDSAADSLD